MKKRVLFATAVALVCTSLTSCLKSDDLEMLKHPVNIVGELHPVFGIPVGDGEMNMDDLLKSLSSSYSGNIDSTGDVLVIQYGLQTADTVYTSNYISKGGMKVSSKLPKTGYGTKADPYTKDTILENVLDIDFFNDVEALSGISVTHVWAYLSVGVKGFFGDNPKPQILDKLHISFDEFELWYDAPGYNTPQRFTDPKLDNLVLELDGTDIVNGNDKDIDSVDMAPMINARPTRIYARYHLKLRADAGLITENISTMTIQEIIDELSNYANNAWISYFADMQFKMPLTMSVDDMDYSFDVDLGEGLSGVDLDAILKTINEGIGAEVTLSEFTLGLDNRIPLNLSLSAIAYSEVVGTPPVALFNNELIPAAPVTQQGDVWVASGTSHHSITASLNKSDLEKLKDAKSLNVTFGINSNNKHVAVKRSDVLKLKAYLKVHPTVTVNIEL